MSGEPSPPPSLDDLTARLALLREEHEITAKALADAKRDENRVAVDIANTENAIAKRVVALLGSPGRRELVNLTQSIWRDRMAAEGRQ